MTITNTPSKFHAAFNPIIFEVTKATGETEATLYIMDASNNLIVTQSRSFFGPTTQFDISDVINKLFTKTEPVFVNGIAVDNRLFYPYKVNNVLYVAVNASVDQGISSALTGSVGMILSSFSSYKVIENYPFDISVLVDDSIYSLTAQSVSRITNVLDFLDQTGLTIYLTDNNGEIIRDDDNQPITLADSDVIVDFYVAPDSPFYIRWINKKGGVDYWMFSYNQDITTTLKSSSSYRKFYTDSEAESGSQITYAKETDGTVLAGAEGLTKEEYTALSLISDSPMIQWYNEEISKWITLTIDQAENVRSTRSNVNSIELLFTLPRRNTQF